jgi:hypothetical protein
VKIPVDFPACFDSDAASPIFLGRLVIGDSVCRLHFGTDGKLMLFCPDGARSHIKFAPPNDGMALFGFGSET